MLFRSRVVTSAQFLLESESNLGEIMRSMMSQTGSGDMGDMPMGHDMKSMPGTGTPPPSPRSGVPAAPRRP